MSRAIGSYRSSLLPRASATTLSLLMIVALTLAPATAANASRATPGTTSVVSLAGQQAGPQQLSTAVSAADVDPATAACCGGRWEYWGWYASEAKCKTAGKAVLESEQWAIQYACSKQRGGPAGKPWRLRILFLA